MVKKHVSTNTLHREKLIEHDFTKQSAVSGSLLIALVASVLSLLSDARIPNKS